jgi:uncharacterized damage-inducible protein DinB
VERRAAAGHHEEVLDAYDALHTSSLKRLAAAKPEHWGQQLPFYLDGKEAMRATGAEMAWGFLFDLIHHRGQLTTYLRPMRSTVPQIYGPSADEP